MDSEVTDTNEDSTGVLADEDTTKLLEVVVVSDDVGTDRGVAEDGNSSLLEKEVR